MYSFLPHGNSALRSKSKALVSCCKDGAAPELVKSNGAVMGPPGAVHGMRALVARLWHGDGWRWPFSPLPKCGVACNCPDT